MVVEPYVQPLLPGMAVTPTVKLVRPLGEGGMGSVWVAEHTSLHTEVVVKFMSEALVSNKEASARFSREAAAAAQVKSPHVVHMIDHGITSEGTPYIVMELLVGEELSKRLARLRTLPPTEVVAIVAQVAKALARAHALGILHRDIKPENIFLCDVEGGETFVKLLDFGIARARLDNVSSATTTGQVVGTPSYMSPEQILGTKEVDFRTDLWSLAVVAYEALTGEKPFKGTTVGSLTLELHNGQLPIPSLVNPTLSPDIDAWFLRACRRDPQERFGSAKELSAALSTAVYGAPPPGPNTGAGTATGNFTAIDSRPRLASLTNEPTSLIIDRPPVNGPSKLTLAIVAGVCSILGAGLVIGLVGRSSKHDGEAPSGSAAANISSTGVVLSATPPPGLPPVPPPETTAADAGSVATASTTDPAKKPVHGASASTSATTQARPTPTGTHKTTRKQDDFDIK